MPTGVRRRDPELRRAILFSVLILIAALASSARAADLRSGRGFWLETVPSGRPVWLFDRYLGPSPVRIDSLLLPSAREPDAFAVLFGDSAAVRQTGDSLEFSVGEPPEETAWSHPWKFVLDPAGISEDTVTVGPFQRLALRSVPDAALIRIGRRQMGRTPLVLLVPVRQPVSIEAAGGEPVTYVGRGERDSTLTLSVTGAGAGLAGPRELPQHAKLTFSRVGLPAAAMLAVAGGVLARRTADRAYNRYLHALLKTDMDSELSRARRYDRVSTGCIALAEGLLAASALVWIRDPDRVPVRASLGQDASVRLGVDLRAIGSRHGVPPDGAGRR